MSDMPYWKPTSFGSNPGEMAPTLASNEQVAVLLGQVQAPAPAAQATSLVGSTLDVGRVRPLVIVHGRFLEAEDVLGRALDPRPAGPAADDPLALLVEERSSRPRPSEGVLVEDAARVSLPEFPLVRSRTTPVAIIPKPLLPSIDVLLDAERAVIGEAARPPGRRRVPAWSISANSRAGQRVEETDVPAAAELAGELGRAEDRRPVGHAGVAVGGDVALRLAADAAAVKELSAAAS